MTVLGDRGREDLARQDGAYHLSVGGRWGSRVGRWGCVGVLGPVCGGQARKTGVVGASSSCECVHALWSTSMYMWRG